MIRDDRLESGTAVTALLAVALIATTASQLRMPAVPLGPGESLLLLWMGIALTSIVAGRSKYGPAGVHLFGTYWMLSFLLLSAGAIHALSLGYFRPSDALHDGFAFAFSAAVSLLIAQYLGSVRQARAIVRYLPGVAAVLLSALLLASFFVREVGGVSFWYSGIRFSALAENPNQLALLIVVAPFLALQVRADSADPVVRRRHSWVAAVLVVVGLATLSDAMLIAWALCGTAAGVYSWFMAVFGRNTRRFRILFFGVLLPVGVVGSVAPVLVRLWSAAIEAAASVYSEGGQGQVRLTIWRNGLEALGSSPLYGLGPGPHSGLDGPHQGFEAHNTLVDWSASSGLMGLALYGVLVMVVLCATLRSRKIFLALGVIALLVFSLFHYVFRQPLFWAYLVMILAYVRQAQVSGVHRPAEAH